MAMAGRKSPWGDGPETAEADPPAAEPGAPAAPEPKGEADSGPRNPWLQPDEPAPPRRSASIEDIFRPRGNRGGGGPSPSPANRSWIPLILAALVAAWIGGTSVHILGKGEQGLVTTFARYDRTVGPGLTLTLPWPLQAVATRNTARIEETALPVKDGENLILTRDRQLVDMGFKLRWRVTDLKRFAYASPDSAGAIARLADAQLHAAVAEVPFDALIGGQDRAALQQRVAARTQAVLDTWKMGIKVEGAEVTRANPPARLAESFRKVGVASQKRRTAVEEAQKWAQETLKDAETEAAAFDKVYGQYQASPKVTRQRMYYETMERVLAGNAKVVVGGSGVSANVTPPASAPAASPVPAASPATPAGGQ